MIRKGLDRGPK